MKNSILSALLSAAIVSIFNIPLIAQEYQNKTALIIGNTNYKVGPLRNPVNDASLLSATLTGLGFEVITKLDTDKDEMKTAIREFQGKITSKKGVALFYYSGHGMQVGGTNYLIPVDADVQYEYEVESECLDASRVLKMLEYMDNPLNIVILDACRNNPFARSFRSAERGLAQPAIAPTGSIIAFSTAPNSVASDGEGSNGLYTQELVKAMLTPDLSIEEVFKYTRRSVADISANKQIPWENSSLMGNFRFIGEGEEKSIAPIVVPKISQPTASTTVAETAKTEDVQWGTEVYTVPVAVINGEKLFKDNLSTNIFSDGSPIPKASSKKAWLNATKNKEPSYYISLEYDVLYNHFAVTDKRGICPKGWKVPSDVEWVKLFQKEAKRTQVDDSYSYYYAIEGDAVNYISKEKWSVPGNDIYDLNIYPNTRRFGDGSIQSSQYNKKQYAAFWSSSISPEKKAYKQYEVSRAGSLFIVQEKQEKKTSIYVLDAYDQGFGLCVRCIKEE
ncbi:MAG: caspase family protein [Bacteroidota bacterium]